MTRLPTRSGAAWPATSEHSVSPLDRFFGGILRRLAETPEEEEQQGCCRLDVDEDDGNIYVDVELPGFAKENIDVRVESEVLTISAEQPPAETRGRRHIAERSTERVRRTLPLPAVVDTERSEAVLSDGVLRLTLPKSDQQRQQRIEVR